MRKLATVLMFATAAAGAAQSPDPSQIPRISMLEFVARHRAGTILVVDVRQESSFRAGHIPGAINVPLTELPARAARIAELAASRGVVTYCACPAEQTSSLAAAELARAGVRGARALAGGFDEWMARGGAIEK